MESISGSIAVALHTYPAENETEMTLEEGMEYSILEKNESGWWHVSDGAHTGWAPSNYLKVRRCHSLSGASRATLDNVIFLVFVLAVVFTFHRCPGIMDIFPRACPGTDLFFHA